MEHINKTSKYTNTYNKLGQVKKEANTRIGRDVEVRIGVSGEGTNLVGATATRLIDLGRGRVTARYVC